MDTEIVIIVISILLSAFFSGMEIAFISSSSLFVELQKKKGGLNGRLISLFYNRRPYFLATTLVGNNTALVLYGIFMANKLDPILENAWMWLLPPIMMGGNTFDILVLTSQTLISTVLVLVAAEFIPKSIFMLNPNTLVKVFAVPIALIAGFLFPVVILIVWFSKFLIVNVFKLEYSDEKPVFGLTDLNNYLKSTLIEDSENQSQEVDAKIFSNAVEFKTIKVRECMIPRTEIIGLDVNDPITELKDLLISTGYSKIIVYKENIDDVIGYCHSLELFKKPKDIKSILNPIIIVPETMSANELMIQFITERKSIALVVDEYGGTSGIVTIEDIIEEIFGEIQDEHDDEYLTEDEIDERNFVLSARHEIDYLNDKYNWGLPDGDYDTLGGLILEYNENIPSKNEVIEIEQFVFTILTLADNRIDQVQMNILENDEQRVE